MFGQRSAQDFQELLEVRELSSLEAMGGIENIAKDLNSDINNGLSDLSSLESRRDVFGKNVLPDPPTKSFIRLFFEALKDLMLIILMIAAIVSLILVLAFPDPDDDLGWIDSVSILAAVLLVSLVQAITNYKQQSAFTAINRLKNDNLVAVVRCGERQKINSTDIVVGDVLYLDAGNKLPADGVYIDGRGMRLNESETTGETLPVIASREKPFMFAGSTVEMGDGHMFVLAVGPNTQSGAVFAQMASQETEDEKTPLEEKLDYLAKLITYVGIVGSLSTFIVLLIMWSIDISKVKWEMGFLGDLVSHFIISVTIFVCAVPEGLPLAVTISLSYSMSKMMKDNNFVRHLNACETMGGVSNICSDKTGTLTTNKMTVTQFYYGLKDFGQEETPNMTDNIKDIFGIGIAVNTKGNVTTNDKGILVYDGKSTECALCLYVESMKYDYAQIRLDHPSLTLYDFDSDRKRMTTVINGLTDPSSCLVCSKGAPDIMLNFCTRYVDKDGQIQKIDDSFTKKVNDQLLEYSQKMLRCLLIAFRDGGKYDTPDSAESDLIILGIAAISDPLRPEVPNAVQECKQAGVIVRMVTGDNIETAKAIAKQCGILTDDGIAMSGNEFRATPKLDLLDKLPRLQVLARSTPMDKFRLVRILKEIGEVVAVTGDGTNDALALKTANVGLSMGLCGTEIAKEASDICILDDNFKSIMMAIMWGRCVFDNVRRFLQFQLTVNVAALVISFLGACIWRESPLKPVQLLWVNLIMDSLGALALATETPRPYLLKRPPYGRKVQLLSGVLLVNIIGQSIYQIIVLIIILVLGTKIWPDIQNHSLQHYTMVFNAFVMCQLFNLLNSRVVMKSQKFFDGLFSNWLFISIFFVIVFIQVIIVQWADRVFETRDLTWIHWLSCIGIGFFSLILGFFLRLIPVKEITYEEVENTREQMYEALKEELRGMSVEEQWAQEAQETKDEKKQVIIEPANELKRKLSQASNPKFSAKSSKLQIEKQINIPQEIKSDEDLQSISGNSDDSNSNSSSES